MRIHLRSPIGVATAHNTCRTELGAVVLMLSLGAGIAHATPIATANSLTFSLPQNTGGNCSAEPIFDDATSRWRSELGNHTVSLGGNDGTIFWNELADDRVGGEDSINSNGDSADLMLIATHGGLNGGNADPDNMWLNLTHSGGDPNANCAINSTEMTLGNNNAEFVDVFACHSLSRRAVENGVMITLTPYLHQYHGFHGTMGTGNGTSTTLDDYLDDAFDGPASIAWVENETDFEHWSDGGQDVCGVALTRGNSESDADTRRSKERYDGGTTFSHPSRTSKAWSFEWICGCESPDGLTDVLDC